MLEIKSKQTFCLFVFVMYKWSLKLYVKTHDARCELTYATCDLINRDSDN